MKFKKKLSLFFLLLFFLNQINFSQQVSLDDFENIKDWNVFKSDGVNLTISSDAGLKGNAIRFDYDFTKGTGYGGIQHVLGEPLYLPENFEFTFHLKAESPSNNFEIKFLDSSGQNVWWVNNRSYDFPKDWKKIKIKKRHIQFAWGPTEDQSLKRVDRIEFTIASVVGGKGTIWIDDLKFEPLPPETNVYPQTSISASSYVTDHSPDLMLDSIAGSYWESDGTKDQNVSIDFKTRREFGGLMIGWKKGLEAKSFDILISEDGNYWEKVYSVSANKSKVSIIRLPEAEARFLKINLLECDSGKSIGIREIDFLDVKSSLTVNDFLLYAASSNNSHWTDFPRYFNKFASYWTVIGVNNDVKEALINEDGMVEIEKGKFSIEPMVRTEVLYNWAVDQENQSLEENYLPIPSVLWDLTNGIDFSVKAFASGEANKSSVLYLQYSLKNTSDKNIKTGEFYLVIRPFQVNSYYQFLNLEGGAGKIHSIEEKVGQIYVNNEKIIIPVTPYDSFGACAFDEGNVAYFLREGKIPNNKSVIDPTNLASGVLQYNFNLEPSEEKVIYLAVPFYDTKGLPILPGSQTESTKERLDKLFSSTKSFWKEKLNHIKFNLPKSADKIINTWKSNLAYILINRDKAGIQPGSRSYERTWIRDGSLTSSALLKSGIVDEVKEFIEWYAAHQYENGKVPCVVDFRGPDPVPEHDSHGQMIYLIKEYFNFTKDTTFLHSKNENVLKAVEYIESLIAERSIDHFRNGNDSIRAYYGLVPESISHEGYSAKPMHSYWDNFFIMKGLKDATEIQRILGENENYERIKNVRDTFRENLYNSLNLAMKVRGIDYIPGCVELGDFDATSTTIAIFPCNELQNLPQPYAQTTFDKYYEFFKNRRDDKIGWVNYTPYENRLIGSFIYLDQPERAHELIKFFLNDQRPQGWNHWAEVVWKDERHPGFIGDMPHTWVGSDFINAVRSMFVYESEYDSSLVLAAALYQEWIDSPNGMSVENLPTYYGAVSYSIKKEENNYRFSIYGDIELPNGGIKIKNFNESKLPAKVFVNGKEIKEFSEKEILINEFPSNVDIYYSK
jgi:hypothetical protein